MTQLELRFPLIRYRPYLDVDVLFIFQSNQRGTKMAKTKNSETKSGKTASNLGTAGGVAAGAALGSLLGPLVAAVGAVVGGIAGARQARLPRQSPN